MKNVINYWPHELLDGFFGTPGFVMGDKREKIDETDTEWTVEIVLPGFKKENIQIKTSDGILEIHGSSERWEKVDYNKRFTLPDNINLEEVSASLEDGILTIHLPKKKENDGGEEREIQIS